MIRRGTPVGALLVVLVGCSSATEPSTVGSEPPADTTPPASQTAPEPSTEPDTSEALGLEASLFAPGTISSDDEEYRISFTPDGQTAFFARGAGFFPQTQDATIMESRLVDGQWAEPTIATFSGTYPDIDPWVSPDGSSLYFSSIRPVAGEPRRDADLWRVDREADGWGEPVRLAGVSSDANELGASITADGVLWFASDRSGGAGAWDLYTAQPNGNDFNPPDPVDAFNSVLWEFNPAISPDGTLLVFTSIGRDGTSRLGDLHHATRTNEAWSAELPLPVNTSADEYHASFSPDGRTLYFVRRTDDGDIYQAGWTAP